MSHKWNFANYFRANAYAWHGSQKACKRIKETMADIKGVHKKEPLLVCEGIVRSVEKLSPALFQIDSSSGQIGNAVYMAIETLAPIFAHTETKFRPVQHIFTRCFWRVLTIRLKRLMIPALTLARSFKTCFWIGYTLDRMRVMILNKEGLRLLRCIF